MNSRRVLIILLFTITTLMGAQNFAPLSNVKFPWYLERLFIDSVHNKLIVSSQFVTYAGSKYVRGICSWNGTQWDSLGGGLNTHDALNSNSNSTALCGIEYNGKLLIGGNFISAGRINATGLGLWDGLKWDTLTQRAFKFKPGSATVYGFLKDSGKLYIYGQFDTIQGQKAQGLATYNGSSFQSLPLPLNYAVCITSMINYHNELYIGGNFTDGITTNNDDILKYNGTSWVNVGGGIKGTFGSISSMVIYNDTLYVAGYFDKPSGNAGNLIMRWNGSFWQDAGWNNKYDNQGIWKLLVHKNKLYAFGEFRYASDLNASRAAVFDGNKWCAFSDTLDDAVFTAGVYQDTIFIAGAFKSLNGDTSKPRILKLANANLYSNCNPLNIKENYYSSSIKIYPNPTANILNIETEQNNFENSEIEITNTLGQTILKLPYSNTINVSELSKGFYTLKITSQNHQTFLSRFIKE